MKLLLALFGSVLLCASVASGTGTLIASVHPRVWFPDTSALAHLTPFESLSEPAELLILGVGLVLLARPVRRKQPRVEKALSPSRSYQPRTADTILSPSIFGRTVVHDDVPT
jgi:hypothetical protein